MAAIPPPPPELFDWLKNALYAIAGGFVSWIWSKVTKKKP